MDNVVRVVISKSHDVYSNQALELALFCGAYPARYILFLWQNHDTVVIGRNQNAYDECNVALLKNDGIKLARRLSGGGAVFHDDNNLNFTFIAQKENFSLDKNRKIILDAFSTLGLDAKLSGRNDIEILGAKVSGNAYYFQNGINLHHGTVLVDIDGEKLNKYLTPSSIKLSSKGVKSVQSRVTSISKLLGRKVEVNVVAEKIVNSFFEHYGISVDADEIQPEKLEELNEYRQFFADKEWILGIEKKSDFVVDVCADKRLVSAKCKIEKNQINWIKVYSDDIDSFYSEKLERLMVGEKICGTLKEEKIENVKILLLEMIEKIKECEV